MTDEVYIYELHTLKWKDGDDEPTPVLTFTVEEVVSPNTDSIDRSGIADPY